MRSKYYHDALRSRIGSLCFIAILIVACSCTKPEQHDGTPVSYWITTANHQSLLAKGKVPILFGTDSLAGPVVEVDTSRHFQAIDGFGFAMTGGSAALINSLDSVLRDSLVRELFQHDGIAVSYLRISIGASDLDDHVFTYDDVVGDESLTRFTLAPDRVNLIPVLKKVLAENPALKIMASPWSAPSWMKDNKSPRAGRLLPRFRKVYAAYLVRYIQEMSAEQIPIDAITIQNEPENPNNTPSMIMESGEQAEFVKNELGPAFQAAGLKTRIVIFDHNADHPNYPIAILNDPDAKKYIDGTAFHLYLGEVGALSQVHQAHPDRNLYFTEQWTGAKGDFGGDLLWHTKNLVIGATRNWSRTVLEWNLASDPTFHPHTEGGCTECLGALTISDTVKRNVSYYIIAQASKFVRSGSVRVFSTDSPDVPNVAFLTPEGKVVLIAMNESEQPKLFGIKAFGKRATATLPAASVATFVW